jgi:CRP/FNR family transcriptional regulator, cyclic AMP receptor protein
MHDRSNVGGDEAGTPGLVRCYLLLPMRTRPAKEDDLKGPLFGPLFTQPSDGSNKEIRRKIAAAGSVRTWDEGSSVLYEDDPGDFLLVLLKGSAKVMLEPEVGKEELILAIVKPFAIIGELAALDALPRSASVITLEQSDFLRIPGPSFLEAARAKPELAVILVRHLSKILRGANERLRTISMYEADGQTVRGLFLFSQHREERPSEIVLTGCPRIFQIAQMLGCRRETVSSAIAELEKGNYLKTVRAGKSLQQVTLTRKAVNKYLKGLHPPFP